MLLFHPICQYIADQAWGWPYNITMIHQRIMETLLNFHEDAIGPMKRIFELCMDSMENVNLNIASLDELPDIPFTKPIVRKLNAALGSSAELDTEEATPASSKRSHKRRRTKQTGMGSKRTIPSGFIDQSTSSSASSLPDISPRRVKCIQCDIWLEKHKMRRHKRKHHVNTDPPSPTMTRLRSVRPHRQARHIGNQMQDFEYY